MRIIILFCALLMASCANSLMKKSVLIEPGMSKQEVAATLGAPQNRQFNGRKEAWQYCETGAIVDDYTIIWLVDGRVVGTQSYNNNRQGICSSFFQTINWEDAPDSIIEFRHR